MGGRGGRQGHAGEHILIFSVAEGDCESGVHEVSYFSRAASDLHFLWDITQFLRVNIQFRFLYTVQVKQKCHCLYLQLVSSILNLYPGAFYLTDSSSVLLFSRPAS